MLTSYYTKQFEKDVNLQKRRGKKMEKLKEVMAFLVEGKPLGARNRGHKLSGILKDYQECHIESDWLLIYKIQKSGIYFARTGTHANLFE